MNDLAFAIVCYHMLLTRYFLEFRTSVCYRNEHGYTLGEISVYLIPVYSNSALIQRLR